MESQNVQVLMEDQILEYLEGTLIVCITVRVLLLTTLLSQIICINNHRWH